MKPELMKVDDYCRLCSEFEDDYESANPEISEVCEAWFCVDRDDLSRAAKEMRLIAGWSQKQLANAIDLSEWQIRDRESGRTSTDTEYCKQVYSAIAKSSGEKARRAIKGLRAYCVMANFTSMLRSVTDDSEENVKRNVVQSHNLLDNAMSYLTVEEYAAVLKIVSGMVLSHFETDGRDRELIGKLLSAYPRKLVPSQFETETVGRFLTDSEKKS